MSSMRSADKKPRATSAPPGRPRVTRRQQIEDVHETFRSKASSTKYSTGEFTSPGTERSRMSGTVSGSIGSASAMYDAKEDRKRAEHDLQLIANRIALLRTEEQRAMTKISETKTRAREILEVKKRNEELLQLRIQKQMEEDLLKHKAQEKAARDREERRRKLQYSKKLVEESKRKLALEKKATSTRIEQLVYEGRERAEIEKKEKADAVRRKRMSFEKQREEERARKERQAQREYNQKLADEVNRREQAEEVIEMLEYEERELIQRLQRTQKLQEKAYNTLRNSLEV